MKKYFLRFQHAAQKGFTIVELMVATLVFSIILLVITVGIMHFTNAYYKGVNSSTTQNTARSIIDTVAQAVQFGGGYFGASSTDDAYCIGNLRFDYTLGKEVESSPTGSQVKDALYQSGNTPGSCPKLADTTITGSFQNGLSVSGGKELLGPRMRLSKFTVTQSGDLYTIDVRVVYGDDDLLNNPTGDDASCTDQAGSQFCAASELSTTVQSRVLP